MSNIKVSILTSTYNRGEQLKKLYQSIIKNCAFGGNLEWLIMDDGSTDNTEQVVRELGNQIDIKYYKHQNKGKMASINELIEKASGDLIIECDSDDYFEDNAFKSISNAYNKYKDNKDIYALCFLKYNTKHENIGKNMSKEKTTMFDLYFKDLEDGEKALVYFADIRKKYKYCLEKNEKFITEARMQHQMDLKYNIICVNTPIMICEYQKDGYTKNIKDVFKNNPYGYYEYFKEILQRDMSGVPFAKRLYVIKHYIMFCYLTKQKVIIKGLNGTMNKMLIMLLRHIGLLVSYIKYN